jgi:putative transposase
VRGSPVVGPKGGPQGLRAGSFFPSLLTRRRRIDQALFAVVMEAYLHGVSTRKVDDLVRAP